MSRKTLMATALAACLAVLFFAVHAADRNRRADADRTQRGALAKEPAARIDIGAGYVRELDPTATDVVPDEPGDNPVDIESFLEGLSAEDSARIQSTIRQTAESLLRQAARNEGTTQEIALLKRVLNLRLDSSSPESAQIVRDTNLRLAELTQESSRKAYYLNGALGYTTDSALRTQLEQQIVALGGAVPVPTRTVARNFGPDDQCTNAIPVGVPGSVTMSIQPPIVIPGIPNPIEDRNFVSFDVPLIEPGNPHDPLVGAVMQIETTSSCATEAECSSADFDTLVRLYGSCASDGTAELLFQADDEGGVAGDSGLGWLSAIEGRGTCIDDTGRNTGEKCFVDSECQASQGGPNSHAFCNNTVCLPAGTYYIEVLGEFGSSPENFNVNVTQIGTCLIPRGDSYEVDNAGVDANNIGWANSKPGAGNGRTNKEIQGHTILSSGLASSIDVDNVKANLAGDELVRFSTAVTQPKPSNGYFYRPASQESDTQMHVQYADGIRGQAGVCNHNSSFRGGSWVDMGCYSSQTNFGIPGLGPDEDPNGCIAGLAPRFFAVPTNWCVPNYMVNFLTATASGIPNFRQDNPFLFHDDNDPSAGDYGSSIELCLPASGAETIPNNPLVARTTSSAANPRAPLLNYFYEMRAQTLTPCNFEREPNNSPFQAGAITMNSTVYGIQDNSETRRTNHITPVMRCSTATAQRCYASPRPAGPNRFPTILDTCPGGGTCTVAPLESAVTIGGFQDLDWSAFDVAEETDIVVTLTPTIIDPQADTELFLRVGPADTNNDGNFAEFPLVLQDDDAATPASRIEATIVPAAQFLAANGIPAQNPVYFLVAGQNNALGDDGSSIANYYYNLTLGGKAPIPETEPNNDCQIDAEQGAIGDTFQGSLSPSGGRYVRTISGGSVAQDCDIDAYRFSITENTRIVFTTEGDPALTDTAIQLEECGTGLKIACDEDGQFELPGPGYGTYWSILQGCLPPGDYCLRVRAWSGLGPEFFGLNEFYKLKMKGTAGCDPSSDPVLGDELSSCGSGSRGPFDTFCDGNSDGYPAFTACGDPRTN
jgi:hypothetical protein